MVKLSTPTLTLEEFLKLPETKPASEFIDGQIFPKPMPQGKHSTIQELDNDILPVPSFARSFNLTVGKLFSWLTA